MARRRWIVALGVSVWLALAPGTARPADAPAGDSTRAPGLRARLDLLPAGRRTNADYLQRVAILRRHAEDDSVETPERQFHTQLLATELAMMGDGHAAQAALDRQGIFPFRERSEDVGRCRVGPAREEILRAAATRRIVMLNELHHAPEQREFARSLLAGLQAHGFRYLAVETLDAADSLLNRRGYPVMNSGHYSAEPRFAEFLREALRLGFTLVPYEFDPPIDPAAAPGDWIRDVALRESGQARNLMERIFTPDPGARVFIYCGSQHLTETPVEATRLDGPADSLCWLACRLRALTGLDPLTIDQTTLRGLTTPLGEHPDFQAILPRLGAVPALLTYYDGSGWFVPEAARGRWDMAVVHPRRDRGLTGGGPGTVAVTFDALPAPAAGTSLLLQAFLAHEDPAEAIPIDQIEFLDPALPPRLELPPGTALRLRVVDAEARVVREWVQSLDARRP